MKIVLVTIGSLGDLHPFIAIGQALKRRGHRVTLAVPQDHVAKVAAAGLAAHAVMPSFETIWLRLGIDGAEFIKRLLSDQYMLVEEVLMPSIGSTVSALDTLLDEADLLVGSLTVFAAPIAAEKHKVPFISVLLQPMTLFSACDPPLTPDFRMMAGPNPGPIGRRWNALVYRLMRAFIRRRYSARIDAVRAENGLAQSEDVLFLDQHHHAAGILCCYSPIFSPLPADAPPQAIATGFPVFDSNSGAPEVIDPALDAFLGAGPAPLVFTLGSFAVYAAGDFYAEAMKAAKALGRRAVLLVGEGSQLQSEGDIFVCAYAQHSLLFPRAAAIVHHGGMGTTGQALRAGRPQLVVPHMADQYDNAQRIARLGVGQRIAAQKFTAERVVPILSALLADGPCRAEATRIGGLIAAENGAEAAANAIEQVLESALTPA